MAIRVRVRYPALAGDQVVVRSCCDWDADIEPVEVRDGGTTWVFDLASPPDLPHVYFKPCRIRGGELAWSVGANYAAWPGERSVYPHFDDGHSGTITPHFGVGNRTVRVYTPPGYSENTLKRYPTVFVHDGANVFDTEEAFAGVEWRIDETLDVLDAMNLADRVIVVALYATPEQRMREYGPTGWQAYGEELVRVVKPSIDASFRTLGGPGATAAMGSSLGGLVSMYLAWEHPNVFGLAACLSPSFGLLDDGLEARVWREERRAIRVYLDSGWPGDNYERTRAMRDALAARGYTMGKDLLHFAFPGARHHEGAWAERVHLPFQFLFGEAFRAQGAGGVGWKQ